MKTLSILILALTFVVAATAAAPEPVLDLNGKSLRSGLSYYILPVFRGRGGGLTLATTNNIVVQEGQELSSGLPLTFSPVNLKKGAVRLSTDLNIKFVSKSTVWRLNNLDEKTNQRFIGVGGVVGNPGPSTTANWFKIEKFDRDYKLVFCPSVCNFCKVICGDVGVYIDAGGQRRLALSAVPFKIMFKKA